MDHSLRSPGKPESGPVPKAIVGPVVVAIRGPSRSGKTTMCERLVRALNAEGLRTAWAKRTHHVVDLPGKASDRIWAADPAASLLCALDRMVITVPPEERSPQDILAKLPPDIDVVLFETHEPLNYPTVLSNTIADAEGAPVIGRWDFTKEDATVAPVVAAIKGMAPCDRTLDRAMRAALRLHGGHGCAGLILGTRLALAGAGALAIEVPDTRKRLIVLSETDRCAVDGIQAVTGCRPGKRTLRVLDYGKLAATFIDEAGGRSIRVAARGDLRERVGATGGGRHEAQRAAYATWPESQLFTIREAKTELSQFDRPGPPRARVRCISCGEEVSDARHRETESGPQCRPCHQQTELVRRSYAPWIEEDF